VWVDTADREKPSGFVAYIRDLKILAPKVASKQALKLATAAGIDTSGYTFEGVEFAHPGMNDPVGTGPYESNSWHWILHYRSAERGGCWDLLFVRVGTVNGTVSPLKGAVCE
jgi:hypothetical protein